MTNLHQVLYADFFGFRLVNYFTRVLRCGSSVVIIS